MLTISNNHLFFNALHRNAQVYLLAANNFLQKIAYNVCTSEKSLYLCTRNRVKRTDEE